MFRYLLLPALFAMLIFGEFADAAPLEMPIGDNPNAPAKAELLEKIQNDQFTTLFALSKSPNAARDPEFAIAYRALPELNLGLQRRTILRSRSVSAPDLTPVQKELSPKKQLELARAGGDSHYAANESARLALKILRAHPDEVAALIHSDLQNESMAIRERGLKNLALVVPEVDYKSDAPSPALHPVIAPSLAALYPDVEAIFRVPMKGSPARARKEGYYSDYANLKQSAQNALVGLGNARGIALFIADDPMSNSSAILRLALQTPDDPALSKLVPLLRSPNWRERQAALLALPISSLELQKALPLLLEDTSNITRMFAADKAFQLEGAPFEAVEAELKARLADTDLVTRVRVSIHFADRKDLIAAPVLLAVLRDNPKYPDNASVSAALNRLMGFKSGYRALYPTNYDARHPVDEPSTIEHNAAVLARIEAWIAANPAH